MQADSNSGARPFARLLTGHGLLAMRGGEALDLLHRLSTNDLASLAEGATRETVLTTEKARIIDCLLVLRRAGECLLVVSPGLLQRVQAWLEKYTIMEDVAYTDVTARSTQCSLHQLDEARAAGVFGAAMPAFWETRTARIGNYDCLITRHSSIQGPGWHVLLLHEESDAEAASTALREALAATGINIIDEAQYQHWRIAHAFPAAGSELTERVNPLECGAAAAVSFTKGCYIGQEVIARLDAQHNVRRQLRMLRVAGIVQPGMALTVDGQDAGFVTSVASGELRITNYELRKEGDGVMLALGCVRNEYASAGTVLMVSEGESAAEVTVLAMPGVER